MVASASTNAASGPLPEPVISVSMPSTFTVAVILVTPWSSSDASTRCFIRSSGRTGAMYSSVKASHISVGDFLDHVGELDLQPSRQRQAVVGLHDVGHAALAGLRVDPDHGLVGAS